MTWFLIVVVWILAGASIIASVAIKISLRRRGIIPTPVLRLLVLHILGDGEEADRLERKIDFVNKANTSEIEIDESIFNRDVDEMLEEELRSQTIPKPPKGRLLKEGYPPIIEAIRPKKSKQPRPATSPKPQSVKDLESSIVSLLEKIDDDELYNQAHIKAYAEAGEWIQKVDNYYHNKVSGKYTKRYEDFKKTYNDKYYNFYFDKKRK